MINFLDVILMIIIIACLAYIYILHQSHSNEKVIKQIENIKPPESENNEEDGLSFLQSNSDMSHFTQDNDQEEQI
jgi:hypothetical protein